MSTLKTDRLELKDSSKGVKSEYLIANAFKVRGTWNENAFIQDSIGISSAIDNGSGQVTINLTNAMKVDKYQALLTTYAGNVMISHLAFPTHTSIKPAVYTHSASPYDSGYNCLSITGDLA